MIYTEGDSPLSVIQGLLSLLVAAPDIVIDYYVATIWQRIRRIFSWKSK